MPGLSCACPDKQHISGFLYKSPRRSKVAEALQASTTDSLVVSGQTVLVEGSLYPRPPECGSRCPVEAMASAGEMEAPRRCGVPHLEEIRMHRGKSV